MNFLADENLNGNLVRALRAAEIDIEWIKEIDQGISDYQVIEYARRAQQTIITEDKDFGEWVFSHGITGVSVVLIRYSKSDLEIILSKLIKVCNQMDEASHSFITITKDKIRRRFL